VPQKKKKRGKGKSRPGPNKKIQKEGLQREAVYAKKIKTSHTSERWEGCRDQSPVGKKKATNQADAKLCHNSKAPLK